MASYPPSLNDVHLDDGPVAGLYLMRVMAVDWTHDHNNR